ncbi:MAG: DNA integrity scanning protein DisA nucleotide-binding domain protein, partial [bacterium]
PLTESALVDKRLGTRHRAGIGITEQTDALVIIVSERTGTISIAENGYITRFLTKDMLSEKIFSAFSSGSSLNLFSWFRRNPEKDEPQKNK